MEGLDVGYALTRAGLRLLGYTSRRVATSSGEVHVLDARGDGTLPPVVLLHGLGSWSVDYLPLLSRLRRHVRRVVAPDLLAHGHSGDPMPRGSMPALWSSLASALEATLDEPAVVYGNSLGGLAALRLAIDRPNVVRGLYVASPGGAASTADERRAIRDSLTLETHGDALRFVERVVVKTSPMRHVVALGVRRRLSADAIRALLPRLEDEPSLAPDELASLTTPIRLFWGRAERLLPSTHLDFFRAHLPPHAEIEHAHGFGHAPQLDDVDAMADRIVDFARALSAGAPAVAARGDRRVAVR